MKMKMITHAINVTQLVKNVQLEMEKVAKNVMMTST